MREYRIQITFVVDAHNDEEAREIAKAARQAIVMGTHYKVREIETHKVEEI